MPDGRPFPWQRTRFPTGASADLLRAAYDGDLEAAKTALAQGADVAKSDEQTGLCALHLAIGTDNLPLARYLIEEANAPIVPDGFGRWPTVIAAECCVSEDLCDYIVEKEAAATEAAK
jgi:hypothetical protein